jgi:hypothetical protein
MKSKPNNSDFSDLNLNRNFPAVYSVDTCWPEGARRLELATEACDDPVEALSTKGLDCRFGNTIDARALRRKQR